MDEHEWLAEQFEAYRTHLQAVAYRMLGSLAEADDAVQESWLRLSHSETSGIENLGGWLSTVVARICLDMLRARNARREESLEASASEPQTLREGEITRAGSAPGRFSWSGTARGSRHVESRRTALPSCCTTSSPCLSTRLLPSWNAQKQLPDNSRAARAVGCEEEQG